MKKLLLSRKFWFAVASILPAVMLRMQGHLTDSQLTETITAALGILSLGVAHEDAGKGPPPPAVQT